jgi:hypothetical protein
MSVAVAALAVGCGKEKKKDGEGGEGGGGTAATEGGGAGAARPTEGGGGASAASAGGFSVFHQGADVIVGINAGKLRDSKLFKDLWPMVQAEADKELGKVKEACGVDVVTTIDSVIMGVSTSDEDAATIVVKTGTGRDKMHECAQALAKADGKDLQVAKEGNISGFTEGGETMYIGFLDDKTMVISPKGEGDKTFVVDRLAGKEPLTGNAGMMDLLKNVDSKNSSIWMVAMPPAGGDNPFAAMAGGGAAPTAMFASILLDSGLKIDAGVRYASPDDAKKTVEMANTMMGAAKQDPTMGKFVSKASLTANGNDVIFKLDLNEAEFTELMNVVKQQLGPMLMMMMGGGM